MADVIITLKVMPASPEIDLDKLQSQIKEKISAADGEVGKVDIQPVAFGLKSLSIFFVREESKGSVDDLEQEVEAMENVASAEVTDVRRAIG
ncbi:MAG: Elongation factor 1-beta [Candidatus Woesearchaeota archaeon]|nr:Elongation factor 1-beta [Candidatus Woesearchaeota archaeon]